MRLQNLKRIIWLVCLIQCPFPIAARQLINNYNYTPAGPDKLLIDTPMIEKWPYLGCIPPLISSDGNYIAYVTCNRPISYNTLTIQATNSSWKKETVLSDMGDDFFFSRDNKKLIWRNADTLFFLTLKSGKLSYINNVNSFKFPKLKKGEWVAYSTNNANRIVVLQNLVTEKEFQFLNVTNYLFCNSGDALLESSINKDSGSYVSTLLWISLPEGKVTDIWSTGDNKATSAYSFDESGNQLVFMSEETKGRDHLNTIWYYKVGMKKAVLAVCSQTKGIPAGLHINSTGPSFSLNGKWIFFELQAPQDERKPDPAAASVNIWSYKDEVLYPAQPEIKKSFTAVTRSTHNEIVYISQGDERIVCPPSYITGNDIVIEAQYRAEPWWPHFPYSSYWVVSLEDGTRTLLKKESKYPVTDFSFSTGGRWLTYWDAEKEHYISYDCKTRKIRNITETLPPVTNEYINIAYSMPVASIAGWCTGDSALLLYDRYDIWKIDPLFRHPPTNITNGYGAKHHIKLRLVYEKGRSSAINQYAEDELLLLTAFNIQNKYNGFYQKRLNEKGDPTLLTMGPYTYYRVESQKPHYYSFDNGMQPLQGGEGNNCHWIVKRQSAIDQPNYFITNDFLHFQALTDLQSQKGYNWLTTELVTWKQLDGTMSQGILYKPENFNPGKKYPVIFNYYEKSSHHLYEFPWPSLTDENINIPWFVSKGYLVFTPDIHYSVASKKGGKTVGEAAYNSVISAAQYLSQLPYVDGKKMAIQGHSFGGLLTNYLVTHSSLFAAASEMAGGSDPVSAYLTLIPKSETTNAVEAISKQNIAEISQGRYGANLWERPDLYLRSSAVLNADKAITPLLIVHNMNDGSVQWRQGIELYMAMRRLGKKCWMLQYDGEAHSLIKRNNRLDYTIRLTQFFDHYLKGLPPAKWMTEGIPPGLKGIETGYEPDSSGREP